MRQIIINQEKWLNNNINIQLNTIMVMEYLIQLIAEGKDIIIQDNKKYTKYKISSIEEELPILRIGHRAIRNLVKELENEKLIERIVIKNVGYIAPGENFHETLNF